MKPNIQAALEAAVGVRTSNIPFYNSPAIRLTNAMIRNLRSRMFAALQELPDDMTVRELREELGADEDDGPEAA